MTQKRLPCKFLTSSITDRSLLLDSEMTNEDCYLTELSSSLATLNPIPHMSLCSYENQFLRTLFSIFYCSCYKEVEDYDKWDEKEVASFLGKL